MTAEREDEILRLRAENATLRAQVEQKWQPIETAPKDGTQLLLTCVGWAEPVVAHWNAGAWDDGDYCDYMTGLTHWMPLPPPPAGDAK